MRIAPPAVPEAPGFPVGLPKEGKTEAWFLGPHADNAETLKGLIAYAFDSHCEYRRDFHPSDPSVVTERIRAMPIFQSQLAVLEKETKALCDQMRFSAPVFSLRSQGHMLWDQTMAAIVGYFAGMLYNQNNVAVEASPVTTRLEIEVGNDLCRMLGYSEMSSPKPWGHITCDGSVANIESLWAARNIKFFPLALRAALREAPEMAAAQNLHVQLLDGTSERLIDLDAWTLLNLKIDDAVGLPQTICDQFKIDVSTTTQVLDKYALQNIGWVNFYARFMKDITRAPIAIVPSTRHYSWPKAATLVGLGQNNVVGVHVDLDARMRIDALESLLERAVSYRIPILSVIAVIGSTEESAVDPLSDILDLREKYRKLGLDFAVHADAAWGGYFASMLRPPKVMVAAYIPMAPMSKYAKNQYRRLCEADSITVDPHKAGYVPYPAGGLCYRNSAMRDFISLKAPIVFQNQSEPTVGVYGVEGSKPGAAAAAVYLSHRVIPLSQDGYGSILSQCIWTSKRFYCRLATIADPRFTLTLVQRLPAERAGKTPADIQAQRDYIRSTFVPLSNRDLEKRLGNVPHDQELFGELGSDQVILTYSCNFYKDGTLNTDLIKMNALNDAIFNVCSVLEPPDNEPDMNKKELILTSSSFDPQSYGQDFVDTFVRRAGCTPIPGVSVSTLISTTMNPWTTDMPPEGDFLEVLEQALRNCVYQALDTLKL